MAETSPQELETLLAAADADRETAWAAFLGSFSPLLLHAARTSSSGYDDAMDSYAYVLERLRDNNFSRLRSYTADPRSRFTTWLVLVARRMCIDRKRERYGRAPGTGRTPANEDARAARRRLADLTAAEVDLATIEDSQQGNPEEVLRAQELRQMLEAAIEELEPRDQLLLTFRFVDGLSAREIAPLQSWPSPVHVYRRIEYLTARLRRHLTRRGVDDPVP
jgi:RNA polymerase sigma factor (sigma-70 family)